MGKIKKILENELVGGTQSTDVYPVTSIKAVYDEENERLDHILSRRGVVNVSTNYNDGHIAEVLTLSQAIAKVPSSDRVLGFNMTFLSSDGWTSYQFNGDSISTWTTISDWKRISVSGSLTQETGNSSELIMSQNATTKFVSCDTICQLIDFAVDYDRGIISIGAGSRIYSIKTGIAISVGGGVNKLEVNGAELDVSTYLDAGVSVYNNLYVLGKYVSLDSEDVAAKVIPVSQDNISELRDSIAEGYYIIAIVRCDRTNKAVFINAPYYYIDGEKIYNSVGEDVLNSYTSLSEYNRRSVLQKSILCYGEDRPCFIIDFVNSNSLTIGRHLRLYTLDGTVAEAATTSDHPMWDKVIEFPDTTSYWYHLLFRNTSDIVIVTTKNDLMSHLEDGYYYVCTIRRSKSTTDTAAYVSGNMNCYSFNGKIVYKDFSEAAFENLFEKNFNNALNPYFSSKMIERVERTSVDSSVGTYANGVFEITANNRYAGLDFWVSKDDTEVYYIFNIKSEKYTTWESSAANYITYGARKYNGDAGTPSGLTVSNIVESIEKDGSLILGVKIQNPDALEDAVYRIMFWGETDTIHIASLRVYNEWEFSQGTSGLFGVTAQTALQANKSYTAFNGDKYEEIEYPAVINGVISQGSYSLSNGEYSLDALIKNVMGYGNTYMEVSLPEEYPYYIGVAVVGNGYDPSDQPTFRLTGTDAGGVITHLDQTVAVGDKYVRIIIASAKENSMTSDGSIIYPKKLYFYGNTAKVFNFHIYDFKAWAINNITEDNFSDIVEAIITSVKKNQPLTYSTFSIGVLTADKVKDTDSIVEDIIKELNVSPVPGIVCWGSSSTAGGGWVAELATLTGMKTYNGGIGGENLWTILGRIGSEPMRLNQSITIPADTTPIQLGTVAAWGGGSIFTVRGEKVTPLLQGDGLLNPVIIDGIEGTLKWTGSGYDDPNGYYTFTRLEAGEERTTLPDEIVFSYGSRTMRNCIQVLLLGYNGGYSSTEEYVEMVKRAKEFAYNGMCLIVGRHAAADKSAADEIIAEETAFKEEFGMMFVSSREYMIQHGLAEAGIEPTEQDREDIANGIVPTSLRSDTAHFNTAGYTVYLNLIYRRLKELGYVS